MNYDFNRVWLTKKFEEIQRRTLKSVDQLTEEQLNWRTDSFSHNIPDLLRHIEANMNERIIRGILKEDVHRNPEELSTKSSMLKEDAQLLIQHTLQVILNVIEHITDESLEECQTVRGKQRSNLDMLHQCAAHYSEHMGQIFFITKIIMQEKYKSTSI